MPWVKFTRMVDYRWPSRAVTNFPAGMLINVKQCVADYVIARGYGEPGEDDPSDPGYVPTKRTPCTVKETVDEPSNPVGGFEGVKDDVELPATDVKSDNLNPLPDPDAADEGFDNQ